jgi:hypothetical protein
MDPRVPRRTLEVRRGFADGQLSPAAARQFVTDALARWDVELGDEHDELLLFVSVLAERAHGDARASDDVRFVELTVLLEEFVEGDALVNPDGDGNGESADDAQSVAGPFVVGRNIRLWLECALVGSA